MAQLVVRWPAGRPEFKSVRMFAGGAGEGEEGQAGEGARETGAVGAGGARTEVLLNLFLKFLRIFMVFS